MRKSTAAAIAVALVAAAVALFLLLSRDGTTRPVPSSGVEPPAEARDAPAEPPARSESKRVAPIRPAPYVDTETAARHDP